VIPSTPSASSAGHGSLFESDLLSNLSDLINRWNSYHFQAAHSTRLNNELDFAANRVLYILGTAGAVRPSVLADQLATGRSNVSKVVKRLESLGLVETLPDTDDSRANLIGLTAAGIAQSHDVFTIGDDMIRELTADWTASETEVFTTLVARLNVAAAAYEARWSAP
jgi:DNA-binding MarR family transcriptional regulator